MASKINADEFVDREGEGKPTLPKGVVLSGVTTITTATVADNEIANSTGLSNDNRNAGDCGSDDYCVWLVIGASTVRGFLPGEWSADLVNEETHTTKVNYFIVELQYR